MCHAKTAEPVEMLFYGLAWVGPRNHVLDGVKVPHGKGQFWWLFRPLKSIGIPCCDVCSKRDHSVVCNDMTAVL